MTSLLTHSSNNSYSSHTHMQCLFSHAMDTEVYISHSTIACKQYLLFPCFPYFLKLPRALSVLIKYTQFSFHVCSTQCLPDLSGLQSPLSMATLEQREHMYLLLLILQDPWHDLH